MKILVFAHIPPPHHGQAIMVGHLIDALRESREISLYHINVKVSDDLEDVGSMRFGKFFRLIKFCFSAIWLRLKKGPMTLYYIPAPAKKSAIIRDLLAMLLLRPWFPRIIFHWHALGLAHWASGTEEHPFGPYAQPRHSPILFSRQATDSKSSPNSLPIPERIARAITRRLLSKNALSLSLTEYNAQEAALLAPEKIRILPNGIPDPCPSFDSELLADRQNRARERSAALQSPTSGLRPPHFRLLYLGHCSRDKGLHAAIEGIFQALETARIQNLPLRITLTVAGTFPTKQDRTAFETLHSALLTRHRSKHPPESLDESPVRLVGFLAGAEKIEAMRNHDALLFPSLGESFGLTVLEAMAWGMVPIVSTHANLASLVQDTGSRPANPFDPQDVARSILHAATLDISTLLRQRFLERFTIAQFATRAREIFEAL